MASQAHLTVVAPAPTAPRRKPHNTNRGRKFPPDPIRPEEFALMLANCVPLRGFPTFLGASILPGAWA